MTASKGHKLTATAAAFVFTISALAAPAAPRRSPEFSVHDPSGKQTLQLSGFKGKVVAIEFLFLKSAHCLRVAQTLDKLHKELGPRGFQPIGIVFGPDGESAVAGFSRYFKLTYPVGYTSTDDVDRYLGRGKNEVLNIPQIVVIDRAGMIRAQNGSKYDPALENEDSLRKLLDGLLAEKVPGGDAGKTSAQ
jgi:thiol-disulfide isomerase/thioredoxin